jgi:hypothetical protein
LLFRDEVARRQFMQCKAQTINQGVWFELSAYTLLHLMEVTEGVNAELDHYNKIY